MKRQRMQWVFWAACLAGVAAGADSDSGGKEMSASLKEPLAAQGAVAFRMRPDKAYRNGPDQEKVSVKLLELPGVAQCSFLQSSSMCALSWKWDASINGPNLEAQIPELPGPEWHYVIYTWDAK
ncbi:MAG: hypothetical protein NTW86_15000, partial [Candidatus Sumerlaeota bacterium]|nr:hypothetical protein [Candidatus Sumerlaeota bacterium]